jgi:pimeloyl-ACP methyl ester carboxylesterase
MAYAKINGNQMYYDTEGSGIPILLIHPPLLTSKNFAYQKHQLSDQFQMITFDIRGHGHSEPSQAPLSYPLIAEDMKQLLDYLKIDQCYLCGYSTGGSIALEAMLMYPDRFLGSIHISAMSEVSDWWLRTRIASAVAVSSMKAKRFLSLAITAGNSDMLLTFKNLHKDAKQGNIKNMMQYYRYSLTYNCTKRLKEIHSPQLLIYGAKDKTFYRYARILHQELPLNELHFIKKERHQLPTKAPAEMNQLIREWILRQQEQENQDTPHIKPFIAGEMINQENIGIEDQV